MRPNKIIVTVVCVIQLQKSLGRIAEEEGLGKIGKIRTCKQGLI